jgi:hypothetical protein
VVEAYKVVQQEAGLNGEGPAGAIRMKLSAGRYRNINRFSWLI